MGPKKRRKNPVFWGCHPPAGEIRTGVVQKKSRANKKVNREIRAGQEEIPGPFLLPENIYNRKELNSVYTRQ